MQEIMDRTDFLGAAVTTVLGSFLFRDSLTLSAEGSAKRPMEQRGFETVG